MYRKLLNRSDNKYKQELFDCIKLFDSFIILFYISTSSVNLTGESG